MHQLINTLHPRYITYSTYQFPVYDFGGHVVNVTSLGNLGPSNNWQFGYLLTTFPDKGAVLWALPPYHKFTLSESTWCVFCHVCNDSVTSATIAYLDYRSCLGLPWRRRGCDHPVPTCMATLTVKIPWQQGSWDQHGAHLGPPGPRWAPWWPHELCYLGVRHELYD